MLDTLLQAPGRVLDIGIGRGGQYLIDHPALQYVGLDREETDLRECCARYGAAPPLQLVHADGLILPFRDGSFTAVHLLFPYRLLLALTGVTASLWPELKRVLEPSGRVLLVFDVYRGRKRIRQADGQEPRYLSTPVDQVVTAASAAGFTVAADTLAAAAVHALLQTEFSGKIVDWCADRPGRKVYLVQATGPAPRKISRDTWGHIAADRIPVASG